MNIFILRIIILLCTTLLVLETSASEVTELYISADGNNKYEAQIKAHNQGMQRAFFILADKINIPVNTLSTPSYTRLKEVFTTSTVKHPNSTDTTYSATVNYKYNLYQFHDLLFEYGDSTLREKFYEYLVLPILKQKNILTLWDGDQEWASSWGDARDVLAQSMLFYPTPSKYLVQQINVNNILHLSYYDFVDILHSTLFKKVMLVVCEYFTNINNGMSVMNVQYRIIDQNNQQTVFSKDYPLYNLDQIKPTTNLVIANSVEQYGRLNANHAAGDVNGIDNVTTNHITQIEQDVANDKQNHNIRTIILTFEVFNNEELDKITNKLRNVKEIENFNIVHDYDEKYKITITTKHDDYALAEGFYLNDLSFKIYGNLYSLINVIKRGR